MSGVLGIQRGEREGKFLVKMSCHRQHIPRENSIGSFLCYIDRAEEKGIGLIPEGPPLSLSKRDHIPAAPGLCPRSSEGVEAQSRLRKPHSCRAHTSIF
jgi:hypothetical protein